jgi:predicted nucleic acid-binding protein
MDRLDRGEQDAILLAEAVKAERLIIGQTLRRQHTHYDEAHFGRD